MIAPDRIGHVVIKVRDLERSRQFYTEVLGLKQMMDLPEFKKCDVPIDFTVDHGVTKSIYFHDPDGHQLEVYCDNPPEYIAKIRTNIYGGMEKLDFAPNEPSIADALSQMGM